MYLAMRPILAWLLGIVLFATFVFTVVLILKLHRRVSGIFVEATSIAGVATLYNVSLAQGFSQSLRNSSNRYGLTTSENGTGMNSIVDLTPVPLQSTPYQQASTSASKKKFHFSVHPATLAVFWVYLIGVLIIILYYRFISKPGTGDVLEDFMDSQSFGVRLFMTCIGLAIKFYWGSMERYMRRIAPYIALTSSNRADADRSVLVSSPSHLVTALFCGSGWRRRLLGSVTLMAVLSEILVITLTAVPFSVATAFLAFEISMYICVGILGLMIVTIPVVLVWKVMNTGETPEPPQCVADAFALLSDALALRFGALRTLDGKERNRIVRSWQLRYSVRRMQVEKQLHGSQSDWRIVLVDPTGSMP
jgi:hypothetical protein